MKFEANSKELAELIGSVTATTGSSEVNFEISKKGFLLIKSDSKGTAHHELSSIHAEGAKGEKYTVDVTKFLGLISKRGDVAVTIDDKNCLSIKAKAFTGSIYLVPAVEIRDIDESKDTLELNGLTVQKIKDHLNGLAVSNIYGDDELNIHIICKDSELQMMSIDSVHGSYFRVPLSTKQDDFKILLTHTMISKLIGLIETNPDAVFAVEESRVYVKSANSCIAIPKTQLSEGRYGLAAMQALKKSCTDSDDISVFHGVSVDQFATDLSGCMHIATLTHPVSLGVSKKGKGYTLGYTTNLGSVSYSLDCENNWSKSVEAKLNPFLLQDFVSMIGGHETVDLNFNGTVLFVHEEQDGYEAFYACVREST